MKERSNNISSEEIRYDTNRDNYMYNRWRRDRINSRSKIPEMEDSVAERRRKEIPRVWDWRNEAGRYNNKKRKEKGQRGEKRRWSQKAVWNSYKRKVLSFRRKTYSSSRDGRQTYRLPTRQLCHWNDGNTLGLMGPARKSFRLEGPKSFGRWALGGKNRCALLTRYDGELGVGVSIPRWGPTSGAWAQN